MGRPIKQGLSYFPKDVDFYNDYKIMDLLELRGPIGVTVYDALLTEIYKNGYYLAEPIDRISTMIVRIIGAKWVTKRLVSQVILGLRGIRALRDNPPSAWGYNLCGNPATIRPRHFTKQG